MHMFIVRPTLISNLATNNKPKLIQTGLPFGTLFTGSGSEYGSKHCRRRKARTVFSDHQLTGLEKRFEAQRYLSTPERVELATALQLSETQVSVGAQDYTDNSQLKEIK